MSTRRLGLWLLAAALTLWACIVGNRLITRPHGEAADQEILLSSLLLWGLAMVACAVAAARGDRRSRWAWGLVAAGFAVTETPGAVGVAFHVATGEIPGGMFLDAILLSRFGWAGLLLAGLLSFPARPLTKRERAKYTADLVTVMGGSFMIMWYFQLGPALAAGPVGRDALTVVGFPIADLVLIFGVCSVLLRSPAGMPRGPMPVFLAGLLVFLVADLDYAHAILGNDTEWTALRSLSMSTGATAMAASAAVHLAWPQPPADARQERGAGALGHLPYAALAAGYALLIASVFRDGHVYPWGGLIAGVIMMTGAIILRQVTATRENRDLAVSDNLTGLANRIQLDERMRAAARHHDQAGVPSALLLIDLDGFKQINDERGHEAGDALLVEFAGMLRGAVRQSDTAARVGGDEFVLLLHRVGTVENAIAVAERLLVTMAEEVLIAGIPTRIRCSIGIALTESGVAADVIRHRADTAMYAAKRARQHRFEIWAPDLDGLAADGPHVLYQPVIDLFTGDIIAVEALPGRATAAGAGLPVLEEACAQVRQWRQRTGLDLCAAVPLDAPHLTRSGLVADVRAALDRVGLSPRHLVLELADDTPAADESAVARIADLRALGVRIAAGGFGSGYSSPAGLFRLPIDILKVNRCFVTGLDGDLGGSAIGQAVIRLGRTLHADAADSRTPGLPTRPMPADDVATLLGATHAAPAQTKPTAA